MDERSGVGEYGLPERIDDRQANAGQETIPFAVIDAWEPACSLQHEKRRAGDVPATWSVIHWRDVAERFARASDLVAMGA